MGFFGAQRCGPWGRTSIHFQLVSLSLHSGLRQQGPACGRTYYGMAEALIPHLFEMWGNRLKPAPSALSGERLVQDMAEGMAPPASGSVAAFLGHPTTAETQTANRF